MSGGLDIARGDESIHFVPMKPPQVALFAVITIGLFGCAAGPSNRHAATATNFEDHGSVGMEIERIRERAAQMTRAATADPYNPSTDNPFNHR
jgi:hypothetical protein